VLLIKIMRSKYVGLLSVAELEKPMMAPLVDVLNQADSDNPFDNVPVNSDALVCM
jgi:hypothetical protein